MGPPRFLTIFTILLLAISYCKSQPVEFLTENGDDTATTICPEELAKRKLENSLIPVETEKLEENIPLQDENKGALSTAISEEATTICPEELERKKQEELNKSLSENQPQEYPGDLHSENTEETTICPEELEKRKLEKKEQQLSTMDNLEENENEPFNTAKDDDNLVQSTETTTICPEELKKLEQQMNEEERFEKTPDNLTDNIQKNIEHDDDHSEVSKETTICPEELERIKQETEKIEEHKKLVEYNANTDAFENFIDEATTMCPKKLARRKLEQSQKFLTKFKELVDTAQKRKTSRTKRQVTDYSSYYSTINAMNQPTYNSEGLAVSGANTNSQKGLSQQPSSYTPPGYNMQSPTAGSPSQNPQSYNPQSYNSQPYNPQAVKTYQQQLRKQYRPANNFQKNPNFYPKTYQNPVKSVKTYRNPSTNVRYPSNGSLNNYYRLNKVANRRQFQGARPAASTSARPKVRVTRKKKFRPSPVFA